MSRLSFKVAPRRRARPDDLTPIIGPMTAILICTVIGTLIWIVLALTIIRTLQ